MLEDAAGIRKVVLACGYVDLRKGIDGLSRIIGDKYHQNPFEKGTLFLFCGRSSDRIKGKRTIASTCSYASFSAIIVSHDTESKKLST